MNYRKVYDAVASGPAMKNTSELCEKYVDQSLSQLSQFGNSDGADAIEKILKSII